MPNPIIAIAKRMSDVEKRITYLEGWESALRDGCRRFVQPAWGIGSGTPSAMQYGPAALLADGAAEDAYFQFRPPVGYESFESLHLVWTSPAVAGDLYWEVSAQWGSLGEVYDQHTEIESAAPTATRGQDAVNADAHPDGLDLAGLTGDDYVGIYMRRRADLAPDTLGAAVYVMGLIFGYRGWE